jgi:hypothetical protein
MMHLAMEMIWERGDKTFFYLVEREVVFVEFYAYIATYATAHVGIVVPVYVGFGY